MRGVANPMEAKKSARIEPCATMERRGDAQAKPQACGQQQREDAQDKGLWQRLTDGLEDGCVASEALEAAAGDVAEEADVLACEAGVEPEPIFEPGSVGLSRLLTEDQRDGVAGYEPQGGAHEEARSEHDAEHTRQAGEEFTTDESDEGHGAAVLLAVRSPWNDPDGLSEIPCQGFSNDPGAVFMPQADVGEVRARIRCTLS